MEEEASPEGSPVGLSNPGTPLTTQNNQFATVNVAILDTIWNADCVEWCPIEAFQDKLVCGTYQLIESDLENKQKKLGSLYLLSTLEEYSSVQLNILQKLNLNAAVLDIKWSECLLKDRPVLALANSLGKLELYELNNELFELTNTYTVDDHVLLLSLDWTVNSRSSNYESRIATSDSKGAIQVYDVDSNAGITKINAWKAHDYEAWVVANDKWQPSILYSGGDDCIFNGWDLRQTKKIFKISNHSMGVTSIASNSFREHILATGSYDENILIWDLRSMKSPTSTFPTGGGVWRLKWDPKYGQYLLGACMHHGVIIADYSKLDAPQLTAHYNIHKSMAYGIDWNKADITKVPCSTIASCSFYDHVLHIWKVTKFSS